VLNLNISAFYSTPTAKPKTVGGNGLILKEKVTNLEVSEKKSKFE
jgi:hypothetical protein